MIDHKHIVGLCSTICGVKQHRRTMKYKVYCESLYRDWLTSLLNVSSLTKDIFQMNYLPEPYLVYSSGEEPLFFLTTNPGASLPFQHRDNYSKNSKYKQISQELVHIYRKKLKGTTAGRRIEGIEYLKQQSGFDGLIQVESCPFHSKNLPNKKTLPSLIENEPVLSRYTEQLKYELQEKSVIALSAVSTRVEISESSIKGNIWLSWQAELIGFNFNNINIIPLAKKESRTTSAFLYSKDNGSVKGFILVMGGNNIPKSKYLDTIAEIIRN